MLSLNILYFKNKAEIHQYNAGRNRHFHVPKCVTLKSQFSLWSQFDQIGISDTSKKKKKGKRKKRQFLIKKSIMQLTFFFLFKYVQCVIL